MYVFNCRVQEWDLDEAMIRVHESNMSKLGEDGKPIYRVDGKVLKGPNYKPPHLSDLVKNDHRILYLKDRPCSVLA